MRLLIVVLLTCALAAPALALDRPWISDTFFYWYSWDYAKEWGGWSGGVYNTPLRGYYDSATYEDNLRSLHDAAEWGITHHFMDYWGYGWKANDAATPREDLLVKATEALQKQGYEAWMSVYQDGEDFDMKEFAKNLDPGRHAEFYVNRFAKSPAQPKVDGKPVYLIYGRNGAPKVTATDASFQGDLKVLFPTIGELNQRWGTSYKSFDEVKFDLGVKGWQRADAVKHQWGLWALEMAKASGVASMRWGLPGVGFSFDVAYQPYFSSFALQPFAFAGPHSYGGIFGVPHQEDAERFIQAAVAKRYGTVFFDTFKNFYHDWEIRIPGIAYPPAFNAFDRFWVQALSHYSEALVHLSWNEWWEGSNLEPDLEHGKTYCEKNLLYSTIMRQCFGSIKRWNEGAKVAVLLNDWHWQAGGTHPEDVYACIQALRRCNVKFDIIPDDFVTPEELEGFSVVIAPSGGIGFGENMRGERIMNVVMEWAVGHPERKLMMDDYEGLSDAFGFPKAAKGGGTVEAGPDMSVYVDVGVEGDERFLIGGSTGREDWGKLAPADYGAAQRSYTVRWTPGAGSTTSFMLPFSPGRDHVLRLSGSSIWGNHVTVLVDGARAVEFDLKPGVNDYEVAIPGAAIGGLRFGELALKYADSNVPTEKDPVKWPSENRVCNLALDWLQLATAGTAFTTEQKYTVPEAGVEFAANAPGQLPGRKLTGPYVKHQALAATEKAFSKYLGDGAPRDILFGEARNILYVNGQFGAVADEAYLDSLILNWGLGTRNTRRQPKDVIVTTLQAGDTDILLAYNYAAPEERECVPLPTFGPEVPPVVELRCLSRDGEVPEKANLPFGYSGSLFSTTDKIKYYGVYEAVHGWVDLDTPVLSLAPGEVRKVGLGLKALGYGKAPAESVCRLSVVPLLPSITSDVAEFTLKPGEQRTVPLALTAREDVDWGRKTVVFDLEVGGRHSYFWRTLMVKRMPELQVVPAPDQPWSGKRNVSLKAFPWAQDATAENVWVTALGKTAKAGDIAPGRKGAVQLPEPPRAGKPSFVEVPATVDYRVGDVPYTKDIRLGYASYPEAFPKAPEAIAPLLVVNQHEEYLENQIVAAGLEERFLKRGPLYVRDARGNVVPSQLDGGSLAWLGMLPPKSVTLYYLCAGEVEQPPTDLVVTEGAEGVTVSNSRFTLSWSGKQGGTVTTFRSRATGKDYAAGSFGVGFGSWGKYDIKAPAINTVNFVGQEKKVWQRDLAEPAALQVSERGPLSVTVRVKPRGMEAEQEYVIFAYQSDFVVSSQVKSPEPVDELVVLDARVARNDLTKIFPNFTGIGEGFTGDQPSAGWREAPYIPPVATMLTPDQFPESLTVIPSPYRPGSVTKFRQGFWPEARPTAGPVKYAEIELVKEGAQEGATSALVFLHSGHQATGERHRKTHVDEPPAVIVPDGAKWQGEVTPRAAKLPGDWWNPYWRFAVPVTVGPLEKGATSPSITFRPDFAALLQGCPALDATSLRAIVKGPQGAAELPLAYEETLGEVTVILTDSAWPAPAPATREFTLYFDTADSGGKCTGPRPAAPLSNRVLNPSFEDAGKYWDFGGGATPSVESRTGGMSAKLQWSDGMGPVVVGNGTMRANPNARYRVSFWAKTDSPQAAVRTNLYAGAQYDFPQLAVQVLAGKQWRRYEQVLPTGAFPPGVNPALRFWVLGAPQVVLIDDVEMREIGGGTARPPVPVKLGAVVGR